ncbi:MAG: aldo/keto reductase [Oscillospiraceae bacterium]|nr:aldo/keto reductase [Oscillospiraceae bacterium]
MNYREDKYGNKISALGFGCMRFKRKVALIDYQKAEKEICEGVALGVNYFDTAYIYPGSESLLGEVLEKNNLRDKVYITTKLPHYLIRNREGLDRLFNEQLKRLRTDHIDYYLMHMLTDVATFGRLKKMGLEEWIAEKKAKGQIRQIGFSYHGNSENFCALIDAYDWDICMIQYNYMDEHSQAGRRGLQYAHSKGIPVVIMEPLRGGKLAKGLPEEAMKLFRNYPIKRSPAEWSFRWLWNQKEVSCVLSGMNSLEMVRENACAASEAKVGEFGKEEEELLRAVAKVINAKMKVGCTGCGYCMPCPAGVDIPGCFAAYNRAYTDSKFWAIADYVKCTAMKKSPSSASKCIGCGKCTRHCPQAIDIPKELKGVEKELEISLYRGVIKLYQKLIKR